jgi:two-component system, cell cycle sensor histidine kinase and response regulator CckA
MGAAKTERTARRVYTVMVADDDEQIRGLVWEILAMEGFRVLPARNGHEGLEVLGRHGEGVDVVLADVVMPRLGGREMAQRAVELLPHLRVLFISGYGDNLDFRADFPDAQVLEKPFRAEQLIETVWAAIRKRGG